MNLDHPAAFDPFFRDTATFTGERRESGASAARKLRLAVPCCILGGDAADPYNSAGSPSNEHTYTVKVRRAAWPDHLPPQRGDTITISGYDTLKAVSVQPIKTDWMIQCQTRGGAS